MSTSHNPTCSGVSPCYDCTEMIYDARTRLAVLSEVIAEIEDVLDITSNEDARKGLILALRVLGNRRVDEHRQSRTVA